MSYLAIYRRFRPKTFDQMIGQEHIVKTLSNQITSGHIGHAYLFCGTRGTGKTTTAKIFARAINCEHPVNGSPCGECPTCKALSDPANLDILEMDAASNNKVENVREIREKVQYPPVAGKYKVYIIDEVHMLTTEAFNALLKTLEEPPAHAVFILATTERHKLPATILSRCMRFDFKLVPDDEIVSLIERIYKEVGKDYEKEAVVKIARSGEGCVRDALSVADLCLSFSDGKLTYNDVIDVLGASDNRKTYELVDGILSSSVTDALTVTEQMCASGKSVGLMCKDVQSVMRDLLIVRTCRNYAEVLSLPEGELSVLKGLSEKADEHRLLRILEIFSSVENDLKYSTHPRVVFETAVLKATLPQEDYNIDALVQRISKLEAELNSIRAEGYSKVGLYADKRPETVKSEPEPAVGNEPRIREDNCVVADVEKKVTEKETAPDESNDEIKKDLDGFFSGEGLPEPPPEEDEPVAVTESQVKKPSDTYTVPEKPERHVDAPVVGQQVNEMRVWGKLVRRLRAEKNIMMWIACQDAEPKVIGGKFVAFVNDENAYNLLTKPENMLLLGQIIREDCPLEFEIRRAGEKVDTIDEDIKKLKDVLDDVEVKN